MSVENEVTHWSVGLFFSGTTDLSYIDPVVIGRNAFSVANDILSKISGYIQDVLGAILDVILDTIQGRVF